VADYEVFLTKDAEADLAEITDHVERHDSPEPADYVFECIKEAILKLEVLPGRGRVVAGARGDWGVGIS
jgi:plasmid stabilization system protein ParE